MLRFLRKRNVLLLSLVLVLGVVLAGCGSSSSDDDETRTLKVVMGLGESEWEVMRSDIFPKFEQEHNVKIEAVQAESADVPDQLAAQIQADRVEIDLITQDVNDLFGLVARDLVDDLSEYKNLIPNEVLDAMVEVGTFDGKLLFLPYRPNIEIAYYNENKFNEAGLEVPRTWDDLLSVSKHFYETEGIGRVAIKANLEGDNVLHVFDFIKAAGGDPYVLNDAGSVEAFTFLQELYPYLAPDSRTANWNHMNTFIANESAYLGRNWPFGVHVIVEEGGKTEIKAYNGWAGPAGESHALGGEVIAIPKGAPNKDLAIEFAQYLMSKSVQETLVSKLAWPSVRTDAYSTVEEWQKPYFAAVNDALKNASPRGNVPYWPEVERAVLGAFEEIVIQGADVQSTLDKYAADVAAAKK